MPNPVYAKIFSQCYYFSPPTSSFSKLFFNFQRLYEISRHRYFLYMINPMQDLKIMETRATSTLAWLCFLHLRHCTHFYFVRGAPTHAQRTNQIHVFCVHFIRSALRTCRTVGHLKTLSSKI